MNAEDKRVLISESGMFYIDGNGVAQRFWPSSNNPILKEETEMNANYTVKTDMSIRTLIVPEGVKGLASDFMRGTRIIERFELPEGLISIGDNSFDFVKGCHGVFANCILPEVVIPQSVQEIGLFAFGNSHIDVLQLPVTLHSPYGRQFKDSYIGKLRLPKEWENIVALGEHNRLCFNFQGDDRDKYGYLRWPSTYVENLEFY